jgi:hypothetical protein
LRNEKLAKRDGLEQKRYSNAWHKFLRARVSLTTGVQKKKSGGYKGFMIQVGHFTRNKPCCSRGAGQKIDDTQESRHIHHLQCANTTNV